MSSVVEWAEVQRLQKAYNEHKQAELWHKSEATKISYALLAARVRYQQARDDETMEEGD